jgi:hypothetical protein
LEEDSLDEVVVTKVATTVKDLGEEVAITGIIHDNVSVVEILDDAV